MNQTQTCNECGGHFPRESMTEFSGVLLCPDCFTNETMVCSRCGDRIWYDDNAGNTVFPLCQSCYDEYYVTCRCGRILLEEDVDDPDHLMCDECRDRECPPDVIHEYYYKPKPIFFGEGDRYFGVELEVDEAGESDSNAAEVLKLANEGGIGRVYAKHDGSIDDGYELVTHPMTMDYHTHEMPWEICLDKLKDMGYLSHQAGTCGLHIHVNRSSLGATEDEQEATIARILYFFEKHWEELLKFSRRTNRQLERWAMRYGYKDRPKDILDHAKKTNNSERYFCVNLQNADTVEFRMFRGTLKYNTIIATLQLVDRVCDVAFCMSDEEVKSISWTSFAAGCDQPELVQYLKERRIYVNDPVGGEEDL